MCAGSVEPDAAGLHIAAFVTAPQPFQVPVYRRLWERHGIRTDLYCLDVDRARGWGDTSPLYPVAGRGREFRLGPLRLAFPPASLLAALGRKRYGALIISGWERHAHVALHALCAAAGVPVIVGSDLRAGPGGMADKKRSWPKKALRNWVLPRILDWAKGALVPGECAAAYLQEAGFRGPVGIGLFGIDCAQFRNDGERRPQDRLDLLYCGRFIEKKRPDDAVRALSLLANSGVPARLVMAGDGPTHGAVARLARELGVDALVTLLGAVPHADVAGLMQQADALVLPTAGEAWGVVVVEAAASGMALVLSDQVGAARDVLREGQNGYVFATGDAGSLAACIEKVWQDKRAGRMPEAARVSRALAERYSFEHCADVYADTIRKAVNAHGRASA